MNDRIEAYLINNPANRTLFEKIYQLIDSLKQYDNSTLTVTTTQIGHSVTCKSVTDNPKVQVTFFTHNNIDNPTILIFGKKTYSFIPESIKSIDSEQLPGSAGMRYILNVLQNGNQYTLQFDLS